jgi:hypothetical protein
VTGSRIGNSDRDHGEYRREEQRETRYKRNFCVYRLRGTFRLHGVTPFAGFMILLVSTEIPGFWL